MARLTDDEITGRLDSIPGWSISEEEGVNRISRTFTFDDFARALEFTNKVGQLAEEADHHPRIVTEWGRVEVSFWSHYHGGVVENDFVMAGRVNEI